MATAETARKPDGSARHRFSRSAGRLLLRAAVKRAQRSAALLGAGVLALSSSLLPACPLFDMSALVVSSFSPRERVLTDIESVTPEIRFSKEVNRRTVEEAFSIVADGSPVPGRIAWPDGRTLRFLPAEPLAPFVVYEMRLSTGAEDSTGNDLREPFSHTFTTRSDSIRPAITNTTPADRSRIEDPLSPITIIFSEAMDPPSLYRAFSLTPAATGLLALNEAHTMLTFTPSEQLRWQTEYRVTVAASAADCQRNTMGTDFQLHFAVGSDTAPPTILSVTSEDGSITVPGDDVHEAVPKIAEGWEATSSLVVTFSEPVLTASATAFARLSPPIGFSIGEAQAASTPRLTCRFSERLAYGTLYTLSLAAGIQDTQGNPMVEARSFHFLVNGPLSRPPVIGRALFPTSPGDPSTNQSLEDWGPLDLAGFVIGEQTDTFFDLYLGLASGASLDPFAVFDALSFTVTNDAVDIVPFAVQINPAAPPVNPPPSAAANEVIARIWVHLTNRPTSGQVTLRLASGLADSRGACLERDFTLPLNEPR